MKIKWLIIAGLLSFLLGGFLGYKTYFKTHPSSEITTDTVYVYDTIEHHIVDRYPYYIIHKDTLIETIDQYVYMEVDTAAILRDHFALHVYDRTWQDSSLLVTLKDTITQNKPIGNDFRYKFLKPQTIIYNTQTTKYASYITLGLDLPIKSLGSEPADINYLQIEGDFVFRRGYFGVGYAPKLNTLNVRAGVPIFKFKVK